MWLIDRTFGFGLEIVMGIFFDFGRKMKRLQNDYFFVDAFEFDFLVRLKDDYEFRAYVYAPLN